MNHRKIATLTSLASLGALALTPQDSHAETISADGKVSMEVNFQTVPTPAAVSDMQSYIDRAAKVFCDMTEGQLVIDSVRFTVGASAEDSAEIVYQSNPNGRSFVTGGKVHLYSQSTSGSYFLTTGMTIAHELGHSILGLSDSYDEQSRFGSACGVGRSFETQSPFGAEFNLSDVNNSIMQEYHFDGSACTFDGKAPSEYDPYFDNTYCEKNADCGSYYLESDPSVTTSAELFSCEVVPATNSELSVNANFDKLQGSGATSCPPPQPGRVIVLDARLSPAQKSNDPAMGEPGRDCGNTTIDAGEMCDGFTMGGASCTSLGFSGGILSCNKNCTFKTMACTPAASCGDGTRDLSAGEECEPGEDITATPLRSCSEIGLNSAVAPPISCQANCGGDWSVCGGNRVAEVDFDGLTEEAATELADLTGQMMFIDAVGDVGDQYAPGPSRHKLFVFFQRISETVWRVHFAVPGDDYVGGADGVLMVVHQAYLTFSAEGYVSQVDYQASSFSGFTVGDTTTGAFRNSPAGPTQLQVNYGELEMIKWLNKVGDTAYAHGNSKWGPQAGVYGGEPDPNLPGGPYLPVTQRGQCNDDILCRLSWNDSTKNFEATDQFRVHHGPDNAPVRISDWELARAVVAQKGKTLTIPSGRPTPDTTALPQCSDPVHYDTSGISPSPYDTAVLILDRSGSMTAVTDVIGGQGQTRLEYMKDAASNFAYLNRASTTKAGLITFASDVTPIIQPSEITNFCSGSTPDDCVDRCVNVKQDYYNCGSCNAACATGELCDQGTCRTACSTSGLTNCNQVCVDLMSDPNDCGTCNTECTGGTPVCDAGACVAATSTMPAPPGPTTTDKQFYAAIDPIIADGQTAMGPALRQAQQTLSSIPGHRAVMLMSDGEANEGEAPSPIIEELVASGIDFYFVPASTEAQAALAGNVKAAAGGDDGAEVFDGSSGEMLPAAFFEGYVRSRSESLALDRTLAEVQLGPEIIRQTMNDIDPPDISPSDSEASGAATYPEQQGFQIAVEPEASKLNVLVSNASSSAIAWDPQLRLLDPDGNLVLNESSPEVQVGDLIRMLRVDNPAAGTWTLEVHASTTDVERSLVEAHIESAHPDCRVQLSSYSSGPGQQIEVTAQAYWNNRYIATGVNYTALVHQPDGSVSSLALIPSIDPFIGARAQFAVGGNQGIHRVSVVCDVGDHAALTLGESFGESNPPGKVNDTEPTIEFSQSFQRIGFKNLYVSDANESLECQVEPTSLACCTSLNSCPGTQQTAVVVGGPMFGSSGGWSGLVLADRASITGVDGSPTQVMSVSSIQAELGADASILGNLYSASNVFARERSQVLGNLQTSGNLLKQNQSQPIVTGTLVEGAQLTWPNTPLELPQFPAQNRGDVNLEPATSKSIRPGAYNQVSVKSRAVLHLREGNYWFESLSIEPDATVITSGSGATRIYVKNSPMLKESVVHATGLVENVLIFSTGTQDIFVEKAMQGTLVAPFAGVILSGQSGAVHRGAVFARGLQLRAGVRLEHVPFAWTWAAGGVPSVVNYTQKASTGSALAISTLSARSSAAGTQPSDATDVWGCAYGGSSRRNVGFWGLMALLGATSLVARSARRKSA